MRLSESTTRFVNRITPVLPYCALAVTAILLWLPFGLRIGFFADEWPLLAHVQAGMRLTGGIRPFDLMPWVVAYLLDSNTFVGINLLMLLLILGKSVLVYLILGELEFSRLFAFGTAILALLYPADMGVFYMGGLTIYVSVFTYLLAVWILLRYWNTGRRWLWIPLLITSAICVGLYEAVYPLVFVVPLLLVYKQRGLSRRVIKVSLGWLLMPALFIGRFVVLVLSDAQATSYQSSIVAADQSIGAWGGSVWRVLQYSLLDTWIDAIKRTLAFLGWSGFRNIIKTTLANPYFAYAVVAALVFIAVALMIRKPNQPEKLALRGYLLLVLAGLLIIMAAFLPYVFSNLRSQYIRTLLHASQGAALVFSSALWVIGLAVRRLRWVYIIGMSMLVVAGITSLLNQHRNFVGLGSKQIPFLQLMVTTVPRFVPGSTIIVMDQSPDHRLQDTFSQVGEYLSTSMQLVYNDSSLKATICYPDSVQPWGYLAERCSFESDHVKLENRNATVFSEPYDQLILFQYDTENGLRLVQDITPYADFEQARALYRPEVHLDTTASLPLRAHTLLGIAP